MRHTSQNAGVRAGTGTAQEANRRKRASHETKGVN